MSHLTWNNELTSKQLILFPMLSDLDGSVSKNFGVYNEQTGRSQRATLIIDPEAKIRSIEVSDDLVSRSFIDTLRKLESLIYVSMHTGMGCPADWKPGMDGVEISDL
jgi:peroxiredoxin (alkyl hydroperoxide reductase subunit C)